MTNQTLAELAAIRAEAVNGQPERAIALALVDIAESLRTLAATAMFRADRGDG